MRDSEVSTTDLPRDRVRNAVLIGAIAGIFCIAQSLAITLANASTYHASDIAKDTAVKSAPAFTVFGYAVLTVVISLLILAIAGFFAGKVVVQRSLGFLTGLAAGPIVSALGVIT